MTVAELVEVLSRLPQDADVMVSENDGEYQTRVCPEDILVVEGEQGPVVWFNL